MGSKTNLVKEQTIIRLQEQCSEMSDVIQDLLEDSKRDQMEIRYLWDFIHYHKLDDAYRYFRENAHEERTEDMPFSHYTL